MGDTGPEAPGTGGHKVNADSVICQDPLHLLIQTGKILDVFESIRTKNNVERFVRKGQVLSVIILNWIDSNAFIVPALDIDRGDCVTPVRESSRLPSRSGADLQETGV
jgi:hypothetical protein